MGRGQTLQVARGKDGAQPNPAPASIKASGSADSLLGAGARARPMLSPRGRDSPFGKLPDILGVSKLTRTEVRKDLDEIEVLSGGAALASLDDLRILPSFYPVKPRVELKIPEHLRAAQRAAQHAAAAAVESKDDVPAAELLEFLSLVEVVRPDILDAEREREQLESKYLSIRDNFVAESIRQSSNNRQRYNFIRALQALLRHSVCQYSVSGLHAGMLSDLLSSLEEKGTARRRLERAEAALQEVRGALLSHPTAAFRALAAECCSAVAVKRSDGTAVMIHAGMKMDTPFGAGVVRAVRVTGIKSVEIDLPFGLLYTSPAEALQWYSFVNDDSCASVSDETARNNNCGRYLARRWQEERRGLFLPMDVQRNIWANREVVARVQAAAAEAVQRSAACNSDDSFAVVDSTQLTGDIPDSDCESMDVDEDGDFQAQLMSEVPQHLFISENGLLDSAARTAISDCLPYLFESPEALVDISAQISAGRSQRVLLRQALIPTITTEKIESMQSKLSALQVQLGDLYREKINYMNSVSACGSQGSKLSEEVLLTRLSMFTRRVRRRTSFTYDEVGIAAPPSVPKIYDSKDNVSPLPKLGEIKKQTKRVVMSLPQKPKDAEDDEADEATAESLLDSNNLITGSRSRNLRGTATTADKDRKDVSSSGGKRKISGIEDCAVERADSSQRSEVSADDSAQKEGASTGPRSKRSRKT